MFYHFGSDIHQNICSCCISVDPVLTQAVIFVLNYTFTARNHNMIRQNYCPFRICLPKIRLSVSSVLGADQSQHRILQRNIYISEWETLCCFMNENYDNFTNKEQNKHSYETFLLKTRVYNSFRCTDYYKTHFTWWILYSIYNLH